MGEEKNYLHPFCVCARKCMLVTHSWGLRPWLHIFVGLDAKCYKRINLWLRWSMRLKACQLFFRVVTCVFLILPHINEYINFGLMSSCCDSFVSACFFHFELHSWSRWTDLRDHEQQATFLDAKGKNIHIYIYLACDWERCTSWISSHLLCSPLSLSRVNLWGCMCERVMVSEMWRDVREERLQLLSLRQCVLGCVDKAETLNITST